MEPTTSYHKPQTTQLDEGQIWVKACHNATRKLLAFLLSRNNQKKLHITTTELKLSSGDPLDYGPRFVEPFSHEKMREYHNARHVIGVLHCTLDNFFDGDAPDRLADEDNDLGSIYRSQCQWKLEGWTNAKNISQPHINAYIGDSQPLRVDRLNSGEVSLSYGLIAKRRIQDGYNDHRYIPITVFSMSDFQVRILQIWHDKQNPKALQVRSSPIMDFKDGVQNNLDDWVTILCWMVGKPVGDTKNGTEIVQVIEQDA
ncbi:unnamed protein product [Penicillium discolor]